MLGEGFRLSLLWLELFMTHCHSENTKQQKRRILFLGLTVLDCLGKHVKLPSPVSYCTSSPFPSPLPLPPPLSPSSLPLTMLGLRRVHRLLTHTPENSHSTETMFEFRVLSCACLVTDVCLWTLVLTSDFLLFSYRL